MADIIDSHWLQKAAMDHQRAGLAEIGGGRVEGLKRRDDASVGMRANREPKFTALFLIRQAGRFRMAT